MVKNAVGPLYVSHFVQFTNDLRTRLVLLSLYHISCIHLNKIFYVYLIILSESHDLSQLNVHVVCVFSGKYNGFLINYS